jgi:hypothetical protein
MDYADDIPLTLAISAHAGTSWSPEERGPRVRAEYAATLVADLETMRGHAEKGGTLGSLDSEFARYRDGYRKRTVAYLASSARCVSTFIAGPSNFPARRMQKRSDVAHRRLNELCEYRTRALGAIRRNLRPDLRAIYAGDLDAVERLEAQIERSETAQRQMKAANAAIRAARKDGAQAQIAALLALGYTLGVASELVKPDFCGRVGFADYELTNNGANIRRLKARSAQISTQQSQPEQTAKGEHASLDVVPSENRVRLFFPGKPAEDVRAKLKANGFRWTPSLGCWQAYLNREVVARQIAGIG